MDVINKLKNFWLREKSVSDLIPFSSLVAPGVVISKSSELIATFALEGIPFDTLGAETLQIACQQLNNYYCTIASNARILQVHRIRRPVRENLHAPSSPEVAKEFSLEYNASCGGKQLFTTELYLTVIERDLSEEKHKDAKTYVTGINKRIKRFENLLSAFASTLSIYRPRRLAEYVEGGVSFSEQLSFYNFLITGFWQPVRLPQGPIYEALGNVRVFVGGDTIQFQSAFGDLYAQSIEFLDYSSTTHSKILDELFFPEKRNDGVEPYAYVETQTFGFLNKSDALAKIKKRQNQFITVGDAAGNQIEELSYALSAVQGGTLSFGEYSYSLLIFGGKKTVQQNALNAMSILNSCGFKPLLGTFCLSAAWAHQIPGNIRYRPRHVYLSSMNFAHLAPFHNFPYGKREGNPWGEALCLLKTPSNQPFFFNFHVTPEGKNYFEKKELGHTLILGASGSGKTVLLSTLLFLAQKYRDKDHPFTCVFFDISRGAEVAIRSLGGGYLSIESGKPSHFNPFWLEPTQENLSFLKRLVKKCVETDSTPITTSQKNDLNDAIDTLMSFPKEKRRLRFLPQLLLQGATEEKQENSLTNRLARWIKDGEYGWVFDNEKDTLDFNAYPNIGIDGTQYLQNPEIAPVISDYLLHKIDSILDGRRVLIIMDEFWRYLSDPDTSKFALEKLLTMRKQNGVMVFATQSPEHLTGNAAGSQYIQNCITHIFLPNNKAKQDQYIGQFELTPYEFEKVKTFDQHSRLFIVRQEGRSVICKLDLSEFPKTLNLLSASPEKIAFLQDLISLKGEDPKEWLPYYLGEKELSKMEKEPEREKEQS